MAAPIAQTRVPSDITSEHAWLHGRCMSMGGLPTTITFTLRWGPIWTSKDYGPFDVDYDGQEWHIKATLETWRWPNSFRVTCENAEGVYHDNWVEFWPAMPHKPTEGSPFWLTYMDGYWSGTDYLWTCRTDIPCHIILRVSDHPPWKKRGLHYKRGTVHHHSPILYFPWVHEVEQDEAGDSIEHSFTIPFDGFAATQWWMGHATADGKLSPSRTPYIHETYRAEVEDLGIFGQDPPLDHFVYLEAGYGVALAYDTEHNSIIISKV